MSTFLTTLANVAGASAIGTSVVMLVVAPFVETGELRERINNFLVAAAIYAATLTPERS